MTDAEARENQPEDEIENGQTTPHMRQFMRDLKRRQTGKQTRSAALRILEETATARAALNRKALRELEKLLPAAIIQARKGRPALLRMILRATR